MAPANSVVCICETHEQAQRAMYNLQEAGIDMGTLSIATKDVSSHLRDLDYYNVGDQTFAVPSFGFLLVSGPLASWIATAFDKEEVSVIGAALATLGIAADSIVQYITALENGKYVLVVHGLSDAVAKALAVIGGTTHCFHTVHGEEGLQTVHANNLLTNSVYGYQV